MPGVQMPHWAPPFEERPLQSGQRRPTWGPRGEALDRLHGVTVDLADRHETRVDDHPVDEDRAGAALALAAALLGAGEIEILAQHVEEAAHPRSLHLHALPVDEEAIGRHVTPIAARIRSGVAGSSVTQAPVASAIAATTAGAPTSIGSSPAPLAPWGEPE